MCIINLIRNQTMQENIRIQIQK